MAVHYQPGEGPDREEELPLVEWLDIASFKARFVTSQQRFWLFEGMLRAFVELRRNGCHAVYVGGSFIDEKEIPGDYDACFDTTRTQSTLDPCFYDPDLEAECHKKYRGDWLFGRLASGSPGEWLRFLARDRSGRRRKLIGIRLNLKELLET